MTMGACFSFGRVPYHSVRVSILVVVGKYVSYLGLHLEGLAEVGSGFGGNSSFTNLVVTFWCFGKIGSGSLGNSSFTYPIFVFIVTERQWFLKELIVHRLIGLAMVRFGTRHSVSWAAGKDELPKDLSKVNEDGYYGRPMPVDNGQLIYRRCLAIGIGMDILKSGIGISLFHFPKIRIRKSNLPSISEFTAPPSPFSPTVISVSLSRSEFESTIGIVSHSSITVPPSPLDVLELLSILQKCVGLKDGGIDVTASIVDGASLRRLPVQASAYRRLFCREIMLASLIRCRSLITSPYFPFSFSFSHLFISFPCRMTRMWTAT
ncbi:hypothetical protein LR48_Vigan07g127100 [Vigna angularis]|uniref:Uncharacterized protein n=1 Tax=Phaseolus angularis TaxID=3914 RepID=A0A0L9UYB1_PHAAN|nr:hypothetical protein LR48_Vigan07g127100 [Vigna angularis]